MTGETVKPLDPDILLEASRVMNAAGADYANAARLISDWALKTVDKADPATRAAILGDAAALRLRKPDRRDEESEKRYEKALEFLKDIDNPGWPDPLGRLHMLRALANGQKYNALKRKNDEAKTPEDITAETTFAALSQSIRKDLAFAFKEDTTARHDNAGYWQPPAPQPSATDENADFEDDLLQVYQDDMAFRTLVHLHGGPTDEIPGLMAALPKIAPTLDAKTWTLPLSTGFRVYRLITPHRMAAALGQFLIEAGDAFQNRIEDPKFTYAEIVAKFPTEFKTSVDAQRFVGQPEPLANFVYANRDGNGGEASGDGFRFRGRGLIKLRGRNIYRQFAEAVLMKVDDAVTYCETPEGACVAGCWYLFSRGCLPLADKWDIPEITRLVTGDAMEKAEERATYSDIALKALG